MTAEEKRLRRRKRNIVNGFCRRGMQQLGDVLRISDADLEDSGIPLPIGHGVVAVRRDLLSEHSEFLIAPLNSIIFGGAA